MALVAMKAERGLLVFSGWRPGRLGTLQCTEEFPILHGIPMCVKVKHLGISTEACNLTQDRTHSTFGMVFIYTEFIRNGTSVCMEKRLYFVQVFYLPGVVHCFGK